MHYRQKVVPQFEAEAFSAPRVPGYADSPTLSSVLSSPRLTGEMFRALAQLIRRLRAWEKGGNTASIAKATREARREAEKYDSGGGGDFTP
jgi:hypothetical protein